MGTVPPAEAAVRALLGPVHADVHVMRYPAKPESPVWRQQCASSHCTRPAGHRAHMVTAAVDSTGSPAGAELVELIRELLVALPDEDFGDPLNHADPLLGAGVFHGADVLVAEVELAKAVAEGALVVIEVPEMCRA